MKHNVQQLLLVQQYKPTNTCAIKLFSYKIITFQLACISLFHVTIIINNSDIPISLFDQNNKCRYI